MKNFKMMINRSNKVPLVWIMRNCVSWMKSMLSRKQNFSIKKFFVCKLLAINYKRSFDLWGFVKLCKFDWHIPIFHLLNISIFDEEETFSFRNILCKSLPCLFSTRRLIFWIIFRKHSIEYIIPFCVLGWLSIHSLQRKYI